MTLGFEHLGSPRICLLFLVSKVGNTVHKQLTLRGDYLRINESYGVS